MRGLFLLGLGLFCSTATAQSPTPTAHAMAICVAAEVGIDLPAIRDDAALRVGEQITVLWALHNWWMIRLRKNPELTLLEHVKQYCAIYKVTPKGREWLLELPVDGVTAPSTFPKNLRWSVYAVGWRKLLQRVTEWLGPCEGPELIEHWNGPESAPQGRMERAACDELFASRSRTRFYTTRRTR